MTPARYPLFNERSNERLTLDWSLLPANVYVDADAALRVLIPGA